MENPQNQEVINLVSKLVQYLKDNGSTQLSIISTYITHTSSICPIWKRSKISISDFIKKFPEIFHFDKDKLIVSLVSEIVDSDMVVKCWTTTKTDLEVIEEKIGHHLVLFSLPTDLITVVSGNNEICNEWIKKNIYESKNKLVGFDTETTITQKRTKPSIVQLSTGKNNLIIQLAGLDCIPPKLQELFLDKTILKIGVGITQDLQSILHFYKIENSVETVLDLSELAKKQKIKNLNSGNTHSLRDLAAIKLGVFMDNKGLSDIKQTNWDSNELSEEQIKYAITDSHIAIEIFNKMTNTDLPEDLDIINNCITTIDPPIIVQKQKLNKKQIQEKEGLIKKTEIERKIKKWMKDDDSTELIFEPMNSFYRNHIHGVAKTSHNVKSESRGNEPSKYVVLLKNI
jgi:hypothetical protein